MEQIVAYGTALLCIVVPATYICLVFRQVDRNMKGQQ